MIVQWGLARNNIGFPACGFKVSYSEIACRANAGLERGLFRQAGAGNEGIWDQMVFICLM